MYHLSELNSSELQTNADVSEVNSWFLSLKSSGSNAFHWKEFRKLSTWSLVTSSDRQKHHPHAH